MSAQRYTDPLALERMEAGRCPECGAPVDAHNGGGGPRCTLTDNGVAVRLDQYRKDPGNPVRPWPRRIVRPPDECQTMIFFREMDRYDPATGVITPGATIEWRQDPGSGWLWFGRIWRWRSWP